MMKLRIFLVIFITLLILSAIWACTTSTTDQNYISDPSASLISKTLVYDYQFSIEKQKIRITKKSKTDFTVSIGNETFHPNQSKWYFDKSKKIGFNSTSNDVMYISYNDEEARISASSKPFPDEDKDKNKVIKNQQYIDGAKHQIWSKNVPGKAVEGESIHYRIYEMDFSTTKVKLFHFVANSFKEVE